jgi:hypothetical protein
MAEADSYQAIKEKLEELLTTKRKNFYLEITATQGLSETLKAKIPQESEIVFSFLTKKPDIFGFVENQYASDFVAIEVKEGSAKLENIYQTKMYKEVLGARYGFLIVTKPVAEEVKRLCKRNRDILHSACDSTYRFLAIGQFDKEKREFVDWFEENPFEQDRYWT